jgi:transglutaminase/protease-like cytokinesis protein 3
MSNKENMMSGDYAVEYGNNFSSVLSKENGQELLSEYYQSAIEAFIYENPDVFYLNPSKMYLNIQTTTIGSSKTYNVYMGPTKGQNYFADYFTSEDQVKQAVNQVMQKRSAVVASLSGNTYNKIKQIHDYLVDNIEYDSTISKDNIYNVYGALISNKCVCEGYSKAFKYLASGAGINDVIVVGEAVNSNGDQESHSWNYVDVDGTWYAIDCTWDDPIVQGGIILSNSYKYKYFLKGSATMNTDHFPSGQFTTRGMEFSYPQISVEDY